MPETPPTPPPVNAITIPIPAIGGDLFKHFATVIVTLAIAYLSAKLGVPVVPVPAPAPVVPPTMVSQ